MTTPHPAPDAPLPKDEPSALAASGAAPESGSGAAPEAGAPETSAPEAGAPETAAASAAAAPEAAAPETAAPAVPKLRPAVAAGRIVTSSGRMVTTGGRTALRVARRPQGRLVLGGFLITALVTAAVLLGVWLMPSGKVPAALEATPTAPGETASPTDAGQQPSYSPPPLVSASPVAPNAGLTEWADKLAVKVEIPPVALRAYAYAEYVLTSRKPACNLRWTTIAAVGKLESNHGRVGASTLGPDGRALPPIVGPALDGKSGRPKVTDTDAGALDNDRAWDHAVGPMQFLPTTWRSYAVDADSDGIVDPNDVDDAALAVANKLCEASKDLTLPANWTAAIKTFPDLSAKVQQVFDAANTYGTKSRA